MKRIVCETYDEMSQIGAYVFSEQIWRKPDSVLGFATGGTPAGMYRCLVKMYNDGLVDFSKVTTFNLDEYYPMSKSSSHSYDYFMWDNLFSKINVRRESVYLPNGGAADPEKACDDYERLLESRGGLDIQLLGIGNNGHIAFNEPADELRVRTYVAELTADTIEANSRFFESAADVPRRALTMGMGSIMSARRILMLIAGEKKAPAVKAMFSGRITPKFPASLLQLHPDAVVILDKDAASML
ncbi:MAG: glucosamine-6-phosphate deaminase [Oscillospiraceae bacterium]|nr:glucosamine-6-phosphate deaminase [Oscillospiraceae bacterium]